MLGGLVTPADSKNTSLGKGLSITSKVEGECLGSGGVVVAQWSEHWRLKPGEGPWVQFSAAARIFSLPASFPM